MGAKSLRRAVASAVVLVCISAGLVRAEKMALQEKLSREIKIELNDVTIAEALESIGKKAGVKFVLSDEAAWKLPQGEATRLSVALEGPLAESMTEMLNAFFMRYAVGEDEITVYPRPELEHILGRPSAKQLELLKRIYTLQISISNQALSPGSIAELINEAYGPDGLVVLPVGHYSTFEQFLTSLGSKQSVPVTLAQILVSSGENENWYLSGMNFPNQKPEIRVVHWQVFRQAKLDQIIDISFKEEKVDVILRKLARWAGMEMRVLKRDDRGGLNQQITVDMQNIKLGHAIRNIASIVGGETNISLNDNRIEVIGPKRTGTSSSRPRRPAARPAGTRPVASEGYVGKISIPMEGGEYYIEFMLRESDLTEELRKLRSEKMREILGEEGADEAEAEANERK